jgi:hypothetical protein
MERIMNGRDPMAVLHMRLRWCYAMHVQAKEPQIASTILAELLALAYQDGALAQRCNQHKVPAMIADKPDLVREWTCGHDDAARSALRPACDCASPSCPHRRRLPFGRCRVEGERP